MGSDRASTAAASEAVFSSCLQSRVFSKFKIQSSRTSFMGNRRGSFRFFAHDNVLYHARISLSKSHNTVPYGRLFGLWIIPPG
jgi:hypothetical protein